MEQLVKLMEPGKIAKLEIKNRIIAAHWPVAVELSAAVVPALLEPVLARHGVGRCWHASEPPAVSPSTFSISKSSGRCSLPSPT